MTSSESVYEQLERLRFNVHSWGRSEIRELPKILLPTEEIYECVNGLYEGGFALLVATNFRVLLIDKKPLNYLTVEDLRFDMINEIDYSHRLFGAQISIVTGPKNLIFRSYNQVRLRKLINHVQHCMAEAKRLQSQHQEGQNESLVKINQQLQAYLIAQNKNQQDLSRQLAEARRQGVDIAEPMPVAPKPSPELADYLYAQSLMREYERSHQLTQTLPEENPGQLATSLTETTPKQQPLGSQLNEIEARDLYNDGLREVFGNQLVPNHQGYSETRFESPNNYSQKNSDLIISESGLTQEINPLKIAYAKLPALLIKRKMAKA